MLEIIGKVRTKFYLSIEHFTENWFSIFSRLGEIILAHPFKKSHILSLSYIIKGLEVCSPWREIHFDEPIFWHDLDYVYSIFISFIILKHTLSSDYGSKI